MINVTKLTLFPKTVKQITVPKDKKHHIIFYSENSDFSQVYDILRIKKTFVKKISFPPYKVPRLIFDQSDVVRYKALKLMPLKALETIKENVFIDTTKFLNLVDEKYGRKSYKRSIVQNKIIDYLNECRFSDSENILLYHVDLSKDLPKVPYLRRSWILMTMAKAGDGRFPFDNVVICLTINNNVRFFSIYNKNLKSLSFSKIFNILKTIKKGKIDEKPEEIEKDDDDEIETSNRVEEDVDLDEGSFESTEDIIKRVQQNKQLTESNNYLSQSLNVLLKTRKF